MWNYLRVRGEYAVAPLLPELAKELPPRARRILGTALAEAVSAGTTSACAENTPGEGQPIPCRGNYLRVRGEYYIRPHQGV